MTGASSLQPAVVSSYGCIYSLECSLQSQTGPTLGTARVTLLGDNSDAVPA